MNKFIFSLLMLFITHKVSNAQYYIPDSTFGINALSTIPEFPNYPRKILNLEDGDKILISTNLICKIDSNGSLVNGFGTNGLIQDTSLFVKNSGAIDSNHRLLVCGGFGNTFFVKRYLSNGLIDSSFGINGLIAPNLPHNHIVYDLVVQADGKIVAAGMETNTSFSKKETFIIRLNDDGNIDTTYGNNGYTVNGFTFENFARLNKLLLLPDGKVVAGGVLYSFYNCGLLIRYKTDGSLDSTFGNYGFKIYQYLAPTPHTENFVFDMARQPNGKIIVSGINSTLPEPSLFDVYTFILRVNANGSLDNTFGNAGVFRFPSQSYTQALSTLHVLTDGKILFSTARKTPYAGIVCRLTSSGKIDSSFCQDGLLTTKGLHGFSYDQPKITLMYATTTAALEVERWKPFLFASSSHTFSKDKDWVVYPTIFEQSIWIKFLSKPSTNQINLSLVDQQGTIIQHIHLSNIQSEQPYRIDLLKTLTSGIYFLRADHSSQEVVTKLIKL